MPGILFVLGLLVTSQGEFVASSQDIPDTCSCETPCKNNGCGASPSCCPCWSGEKCDIFDNKFYPTFHESYATVVTQPFLSVGSLVYTVSADDEDFVNTCNSRKCSCASIRYILSSETDEFSVDESTGDIRSTRDIYVAEKTLVVEARNIHPCTKDVTGVATMTLNIVPNKEEVLDRHRRDINFTGPAVPGSVAFYFTKMGAGEEVTAISIGKRISLRAAIHLPAGNTESVVAELFTPINESVVVMMLYGAKVSHVGSNLVGSIGDLSAVTPTLSSRVNTSDKNNHAVFNFGDINNTVASASNYNDSAIFIDFDAVVLDISNSLPNASSHWISAGLEHTNGSEIWIGQTSMAVLTDKETSQLPEVNLGGPSSVEIGRMAELMLNVTLKDISTKLILDVYSEVNESVSEVMSVKDIGLTSHGISYDGLLDRNAGTKSFHQRTGQMWNYKVSLDLGTVVQATRLGSTAADDSLLKFKVVMWVKNDSSLVGTGHYVGAAVQINSNRIWAGQFNVTIGDASPLPPLSSTPTFKNSKMSAKNVTIGQSVLFEFTLETPPNSMEVYQMQVFGPLTNGLPQLQVCSMKYDLGANVIAAVTPTISYKSRSGDVNDIGTISFGLLSTTDLHDTSYNPSANNIAFSFSMTVVNHSANVVGSNVWVSSGIEVGSDKLWIGQFNLNFTDQNQIPPGKDDISVALRYGFTGQEIPIGGVPILYMDVTLKPNIFYDTVSILINTPYMNDSAVMSACKVDISFIGKNLACFPSSHAFSLRSRYSSPLHDQAQVNLGGLTSIPIYSDADGSKFTVRLIGHLQDHVAVVNGSRVFVAASVQFSSEYIYVGEAEFTVLKGMDVHLPANSEKPMLFVNSSASTIPGGSGQLIVHLKIPRSTGAVYSFKATGSRNVTICLIKILEAGANLPCEGRNFVTTSSYASNVGSVRAVLTNIGTGSLSNSTLFDEDSVKFAVTAKLDGNVPVSSLETVTFELMTGSSTVNATGQLTVISPIASASPNVKLVLASTNATTGVALGGLVKVKMDLTMGAGCAHLVTSKFLTPLTEPETVQICEVSVDSRGDNIPCLNTEGVVPTYTSRNNSKTTDIGTLDLGTICRHPIDESKIDNDVVSVLVVAQVLQGKLQVGDNATLSGTTMVNQNTLYAGQISMAVTGPVVEYINGGINPSLDIFQVSSTTIGIRQTAWMLVNVTIPPMSLTAVNVTVKSENNNGAFVIVKGIVLETSGRNLPCLSSKLVVVTLSSSSDTTQMDTGLADLGIVANSGSYYGKPGYSAADDLFTLNVTVELQDNEMAHNGSLQSVTVKANVGGNIFARAQSFEVLRTQAETPVVHFEVNADNSLTYAAGEDILVMGQLSHNDSSTAETVNVSVTFYMPSSAVLKSLTSDNPLVLLGINSSNEVTVTLSRLYFTDAVRFNLTVRVTSDTQGRIVIPYIVSYSVLPRSGLSNVTHFGDMEALDFNRNSERSQAAGCSVTEPLVQPVNPCQLQMSITINSAYKDPRMTEAGWQTSARTLTSHDHVTVDFFNVKRVITLGVASVGGLQSVTSLQLTHSMDGLVWNTADNILLDGSYSEVNVTLTSPIEARLMRLAVLNHTGEAHETAGLKVELYGCLVKPLALACSANPTQVAEYVRRSFLRCGTSLYVCDLQRITSSLKSVCSYTSNGTTWQKVDARVGALALCSSTHVYGVDRAGLTYVMSAIGSEQWYSITPSVFTEVKGQLGVTVAVNIEWTSSATFKPGAVPVDSAATYTYGYGYEGVYKSIGGSWTKVSDWTSCCS